MSMLVSDKINVLNVLTLVALHLTHCASRNSCMLLFPVEIISFMISDWVLVTKMTVHCLKCGISDFANVSTLTAGAVKAAIAIQMH